MHKIGILDISLGLSVLNLLPTTVPMDGGTMLWPSWQVAIDDIDDIDASNTEQNLPYKGLICTSSDWRGMSVTKEVVRSRSRHQGRIIPKYRLGGYGSKSGRPSVFRNR